MEIESVRPMTISVAQYFEHLRLMLSFMSRKQLQEVVEASGLQLETLYSLRRGAVTNPKMETIDKLAAALIPLSHQVPVPPTQTPFIQYEDRTPINPGLEAAVQAA